MRQAMICWFGTKNVKEFTSCLCAFDSNKKRPSGRLKTTLSDNTCNNIASISVHLWTGSRIELCRGKLKKIIK